MLCYREKYHNFSGVATNFTCGFSISFLLCISFNSLCFDSILPALTSSGKEKYCYYNNNVYLCVLYSRFAKISQSKYSFS